MTNIEKIVAYIKDGCNDKHRIGLELEHLIYDADHMVISYDQMTACLTELAQAVSGRLYIEDDKILGVEADGYALSLEPGCQLEISIEPKENVAQIQQLYNNFRTEADRVFGARGFLLHEEAVLPFVASGECPVEQIGLLPKARYRVMDEHFRETGNCGAYMMRASASTQVSIDFSSEEDALRKVRVLEKIAPIVALLTENRDSIVHDARWQEYLIRSQIWRSVDPVRCGYFPGSVSDDYSLEAYASHIYKNNSILVKEAGILSATGDHTAEEWYGEGRIENVDYLISMYFPTVRMKKYIEYRVADSMPAEDVWDYIALIRNIVYQESVLRGIDELFACVKTTDDIYAAEDAIMQKGYDAVIYGRPIQDWIKDLFALVLKYAPADEGDRIRRLLPITFLDREYLNIVRGNEAAHISEDRAIKDYLNSSTAKYHNRVVRTLYVPKLFTNRELRLFHGLIDELYGIFDKVIMKYLADGEYRKLFGFSKELEQLILQKPLYTRNIPMARIDLFLDEKTRRFKFCEFNTDGASAMNEDRELNIAFAQSRAFKEFEKIYGCHTFELFDSWVEEALKIYREYRHDEHAIPRVAIVDFLENATINEFYIFKEAFEKKGCTVTVCDVRDLRFDGEQCWVENGTEIDLVYRRAVTSDMLQHMEEADDFLRAFRSGKLCVLGDFRTQIVHNKILYKILHMDETMEFLNARERMFVREHIPFTMSLDDLFDGKHDAVKQEVFTNKDRWIIKPEDSYGSKGVHAGVEIEDEAEWQRLVDEAQNRQYIIQEFCTPYRLENIVFRPDGWDWTDTSNLTGLFVYNGIFKGIYSRVSYEQMISTQYNEMSLPTVIVG